MKRHTLAVALEQPGTDDLQEITLQTDNRDMVRWDLVRARKGWPTTQEAPVLWMTALAYFALLRSNGLRDGETVEQFIDRCVSVRIVKRDGSALTADEAAAGEGAEEVDPSQPGVAPGY